jgi:hypothetical protein
MKIINKIIDFVKDWSSIIIVVAGFIWITFSIFESIILTAFFSKYTICKPFKLSNGRYHYKDIEYTFKYKNKTYLGRKSYNSCDTSRSFIVRFSFVNPKVNYILQDKQVPYGDWEIPPDGWEEIPNWVETVKQDY